jgi:hypothetical protein
MRPRQRTAAALMLALALALSIPRITHGQAVISTTYYWGCTYYIFWWAVSTDVVSTTSYSDPSTWNGIEGTICQYLGQCSVLWLGLGNETVTCS